MFNDAGARFFATLRDAALERLGDGHACTDALKRAVSAPSHEHFSAAQDALNALDEGERDRLLQMAHKTLREDPRAILEAWPVPPQSRAH